jgi:hypothetical protein
MAFKVEAAVSVATSYEDDLNDVTNAFSKAEIEENGNSRTPNSSTASTEEPKPKKPIPERITGDKVSEYDFIEIKTMRQWKDINWKEFYPQLMLSNNRSLYAARYTRGLFVSIDKYNIGDPNMKLYQEKTEQAFGRLLEFFRRLLITLKQPQSGAGPWSLVCLGGNLKLYKLEKDMLSLEEISRFG